MESNGSGAKKTWDKDFKDAEGNLLWEELERAIIESGAKPMSFEEVHRGVIQRRREEEQKNKSAPSE